MSPAFRRKLASLALAVAAGGLAICPRAVLAAEAGSSADVYAEVGPAEIVLGNSVAERRWNREGLRTTLLLDKRRGGRSWGGGGEFSLSLGGAPVDSEAFTVESASIAELPRGGLRVTMELGGPAGLPGALRAVRIAEAYPGIAGFRTQTILHAAAPVAIAGATLEQAAIGPVAPTLHAFRAGADWRQPGYTGPDFSVGDPRAGTWRVSQSAARGAPLGGSAQWLSLADGERGMFMVTERVDFPSSLATYDGARASVGVDYARDVIILGPLEEQGHVENPLPGSPGRQRTIRPGVPFSLEPVFTGFADHAGDEAWQHHRYLVEHRLTPYEKGITFNSNGTDSNRISTGAKDDMNMGTVEEVAPIARRLGVETFILDDGWQARSGDWQPDSPEFPEPRWDGRQGSKFAPRFPDPRFEEVRRVIAPMKLGLWMSPMHFNPSSATFGQHPDWVCQPVGSAILALNTAEPDSSSNEAGIVTWGIPAIPHIEARIREAIERWGVTYWKFDFLAWLDCAGQGDVYEMHDAFLAMIDRLQRDHPRVTFQIDETNDYRLFPFESVARGPSWFQNGSPPPERLLHNLWNLSPYVPAFSLGQHALGGEHWKRHPVATLMAAALPSHITFFSDLRRLPQAVLDEAAPWLRFHRRHRELLTQVLYPLLDDPLENRWTALQSWDPDAGRGALLAFRQDAEDPERRIPLENVPPGRRFDLIEAPADRYVGTVSSEELTRGLAVHLPEKRLAQVLLVVPATPRASCLARRSPIGPRNIGRVRIGFTRSRLLGVRVQPTRRTRRRFRYCVKGGRGRVVAGFSRRGRVVLVATTAPSHGNRGVRPGAPAARLRAYPTRVALGPGLRRATPRSPRIIGVRRGRVRFVAVATRRLLRRPRALRRQLRLAGLRRPGGKRSSAGP